MARKASPAAKAKKRIVLVDDHAIVRDGLAQLINHEAGLSVCGQAADMHTARKVVAETRPDLAIVDLSLKDGSGIELIKDLRVRQPDLPILVLSMHNESFYAERVLRAGARGYITKDDASDRIISAVSRVLAGEIYLSEKMSAKMLSKFVQGTANRGGLPTDRLSDRELEAFEMIGRGFGTRQIADKMHLSVKTVETYRARIREKLNLQDGSELLQQAIQWVQTSTDV